MTKPQILAELETLRDFVNDAGKEKLSSIAASVQNLTEVEAPPVVVPAPEPPPPAPVDRRSDERDPGQADQMNAEKLGLVGK